MEKGLNRGGNHVSTYIALYFKLYYCTEKISQFLFFMMYIKKKAIRRDRRGRDSTTCAISAYHH
jgi:hypothetical protein